MSVIHEALARRMQGGGGTPMQQQVSTPQGGSPLQAPSPVAPTGPLAPTPAAPQPAPQQPQSAPQGQGGAAAGNPGFDDDTKAVSKALIARLLKVL